MAAAVVRGIGGGLGRSLRELRVHLCQRSAGSRGAREFIEQHYVTLKQANPDFPILIRECSGVQPRLWARYVPFKYWKAVMRSPQMYSPCKQEAP
eukprot:XP_015149008.1 NADH dehydrogenase [ubiquinone] 1 alpha subcomplex subunit 2 isoform X1 [Gallus gallus]